VEKNKEHTKTGPRTRGMGVEWLWKFTSCATKWKNKPVPKVHTVCVII